MNRAARRRANRRRMLIEAGQVTKDIVWRILSGWQREVEYRARVAFDGREYGGNIKFVPAVWALKNAKLDEARRLENCCPEIPVVEELHEYCRRAIARYMGPGMVRLGPRRPQIPA